MKKFLAMTLAAVMALSMAACSEKDDDEEDEKDNSSVSDSADKGGFKADDDDDDSSKEDEKPADDSSKEDEKPADDDNDEKVEVTPSMTATGELSNGVVTAGNLKITVGEGWSEEELEGSTYFVPGDYLETGNNLNIIISAADPYISLYTEDLVYQMYSATYSDIVINEFENKKICGFDAIEMTYSLEGMTLTQVMLSTDTESYVLTFTGNTGDFANISGLIDSIDVK